jgi:hypothetical protein
LWKVFRPRNAAEATQSGEASAPPPPIPSVGQTVAVWRLVAHHEHPAKVTEWCRREGVIAIGWGNTGDLQRCSFQSATELTGLLAATHPGSNPSSLANGGRSLWKLYAEMQVGDLVIVSAGSARVLTMRVTGGYFFDDDDPDYYEHRRRAEAVAIDPDLLWHRVGGAKRGEGVYSALICCERRLTLAEYGELLGTASSVRVRPSLSEGVPDRADKHFRAKSFASVAEALGWVSEQRASGRIPYYGRDQAPIFKVKAHEEKHGVLVVWYKYGLGQNKKNPAHFVAKSYEVHFERAHREFWSSPANGVPVPAEKRNWLNKKERQELAEFVNE